jgi:putative phosphoribosyl transferase
MMERPIEIRIDGDTLHADLTLPDESRAVVVFAHGSGSSRHSPRNRQVAGELQRAGFGTLLIDLLTQREEDVDLVTRHLRFDIALLSSRLERAIGWLRTETHTAQLPIGLFGASTGAGAALVTAGKLPGDVGAIVSRGGRPDLAAQILPSVKAPTLLIVGERDVEVLRLNEGAIAQLNCEKELTIVPGATHLFEEKGALEQVAKLAVNWFEKNLPSV